MFQGEGIEKRTKKSGVVFFEFFHEQRFVLSIWGIDVNRFVSKLLLFSRKEIGKKLGKLVDYVVRKVNGRRAHYFFD